jgi:Na+-driven multidrug efflux pump
LHAVVVSAGFVLGVGYGALGVAISYAISNWITLLPVLALTFAGTNLRLRDYFNGISHAVYMTAAAIAVSMLIRHFGATSGDNALNALVAVVTYGATIAISVWFSQSCRALISSFFRYFNRRAVT